MDVLPAMAEAIERRRRELHLSPGDFAAKAGLTRQGLAPVRNGVVKAYQDKVRLGVARALAWPDDALERLMAGEDPATFETVEHINGAAISDRLAALERRFDRIETAVDQLLADRS